MALFEGAIIKMLPTIWSKVTEPYYVQVLFYDPNAAPGEVILKTDLPGEHSLEMIVGSNWEYHKRRMKVIGHPTIHRYLLKNQSLR